MSNVRVCVDVVGGDEKPQVVLDGIELRLRQIPRSRFWPSVPPKSSTPLPQRMPAWRPWKPPTSSAWRTIPSAL